MFKKKMPKNPWRWIQVNISIILSHKYPYVHILMTFINLLKCTFFQIFFQFISFLTPGVIYRCDMTKDTYTPTVSSTGSFTQFPSMFRLFHWLLMDHFHCFFISLIYWYLNWAQILICFANRKLYKKYYNFTCIGYKRCIWIWYQIYIITCTTQSFVRLAAISNLRHWTYLCLF